MPQYRMGEALGLRQRPNPLKLVLDLIFGATLPRFDPTKYGLADYSFYEGVVDFNLAKANGVQRAIIRVGQGYYGMDSQFKNSSASSKGVLPRDFYWMLDAKQSANGQALTCAKLLQTYGQLDDDSTLYCDFEIQGVDASFLWGFIYTLEQQMPDLKIGIYTGYSFWQTYGSALAKFGFDQYPLWIAWPVNPYVAPKPLAPWADYTYHQWTFAGDGKFYGCQSLGVDLSYMNPKLVTPPPPPPVDNHIVTIKYDDGASDEVQFQSNLSQPLSNAAEVDIDTVPFHRVAPVPPPPPPPPTELWYRVRHDQETAPCMKPRMLCPGSNNDPTKGIPETVNLENSNPVKLTKGWQLFIAALLKQNAPDFTPDQIDHAYRNLLGNSEAWSNGTGYPQNGKGSVRADFVGGTDLSAKLPMLDRSRISGGNVVKVLDGGKVYNIAGEPCLKVLTLRADTVPDPALVNHTDTPWLVFNCTTTTPFKIVDANGVWTGRWRCNRFPQLKDRDVPMPLITDVGYGFIAVERLEPIDSPFGVNNYVFA